jgi:phage shock protein PspC (stress-responsive transcriptional regulator)
MKKTFSVNLGNRVYHIDDDAYNVLKDYLDRIEAYFIDQKEREDIMNDIELRMSELFSEHLGQGKQVITLADVRQVIAVMGDPRQIGGGEEEPRRTTYRRYGSRRMYRDPDDRLIAGVCSGLAAYFDMDPVVMRILFIIFLILGFGVLVYLILWIVVPEARTTAQKIEMHGDPVNTTNIGNFFRDEFDNVRRSFRRKNK